MNERNTNRVTISRVIGLSYRVIHWTLWYTGAVAYLEFWFGGIISTGALPPLPSPLPSFP